jgi:elongator complex protein 2
MDTEYIAAGANRHPSCADWHEEILAYGSGRNVALWRPHVSLFGSLLAWSL